MRRGWCEPHYDRWKKHGDPSYERPVVSIEERFWSKVDRLGGPDACWLYLDYASARGYGQFTIRPGLQVGSHRYAYELLVGPIASGLTLDHTCHTYSDSCPPGWACPHRRCCNPRHLEPVTLGENVRRAFRRLKRG